MAPGQYTAILERAGQTTNLPIEIMEGSISLARTSPLDSEFISAKNGD